MFRLSDVVVLCCFLGLTGPAFGLCYICDEDVNGDFVVNSDDVDLWQNCFFQVPGACADCVVLNGDVDCDGQTDVHDSIAIICNHNSAMNPDISCCRTPEKAGGLPLCQWNMDEDCQSGESCVNNECHLAVPTMP